MTNVQTLIKNVRQTVSGWTEEKKLFAWSMLLLSIISFAPNNKIFVVVSLLFIAGLYSLWRNLVYALLYAYILFLPFQNGKGLTFLVVPGEFVYGNNPFTMTVTLTISGILTILLIYIYFRNKIFYNKNASTLHVRVSDYLLGIILVTNILSSISSSIPLLSSLLTLQIGGYIFIYYFIQIRHIKQWIVGIIVPLISSLCIFEGALSVLQYANIGSFGGLNPALSDAALHAASEDSSFFRTLGSFSHPNFLGYFMAVFIPILFYVSLSKYTTYFSKVISAIGSILGLAALVLSGSRASWIFGFLSFIVLFFVPTIRSSLKITPPIKKLYSTCLILLTVAIPAYIFPRLSQFNLTFGTDGGAQFRTDLITKSIATAILHPFGIGLGMFPQVLLLEIGNFASTPTQPHNLLAQIVAASGFIGLVSFVLFIFSSVKAALSQNTQESLPAKNMRYICMISFGGFLSLSMFYPILTEQQIFGWLWILLSIIV
jgi:O-antigen ligase